MIARYADRSGLRGGAAADFAREFWLQAVQRKLKDAGRFVFIDRVRKNPSFLPSFPRSLSRAGRGLRRSGGLDGLGALLERLVPGFPDETTVPPATS
jgi:aminoglycoside/choline kinase family phosphotransferase